MAEDREHLEADVCVVGAGIVGLAHAHEARRRGLRVVVLDRDERAVGASVRNFGHVFAAGQRDGEDLELALAARDRWLELGARAGLEPVQAGTLIVAREPDELAVLEDVAAGDPRRGAELLTAAQAGELAPIPTAELIGALHTSCDLRVDPRRAVAALAALLAEDPEAELRSGAHVHAVEPGLVSASVRAPSAHARGRRGRAGAPGPTAGDSDGSPAALCVSAPLIIVCPGPDHRSLPPELQPGLESLTRCQLQMLRVAAPGGRRYRPGLVTGLSLVRYPAFASRPSAAALRERLQQERPELLEHGIHLLVTQLPDGDLIIGDTHTYGDTLPPFGQERLNELLLAEAHRLLGVQSLEVRERWHGIYPSLADAGNFLITAPLPGVRVVEVISGLGMTLSFGRAPGVLDELMSSVPAPAR
jgi:D-hydroxyproline dehydrogenase subunit beta